MASKPYFVALGDIHLNPRIWTNRPDVQGDALLGLQNVVDVGCRLGVPIVLVGDLYDHAEQRDPELMRSCQVELDRAHDKGLQVYAIQGNHDKRAVPWYLLHRHVQHIGDGEALCFKVDGPLVVGFDYDLHDRIRDKLLALSTASPMPKILFLHQAVKQALGFEGAWNCDLEWVPEGIPLTVMGDIHKEWSQRIRPGQEALYTGSGCARSVAEFGDRSITVVNEDLTWSREPVWTRQMIALQGAPEELDEKLTTWLASRPAKPPTTGYNPWLPFVRLTFMEDQVPAIQAIQAKHPGVLWDLLPVKIQHGSNLTITDPTLPSRQEILDRVLQAPNNATLNRARRLALDLLDAKSPADVLLQHRTAFLENAPC